MNPIEIKGYQILLAFLLDLILGDPKSIPHPVRGIGSIILFYERVFRKIRRPSERVRGVLFFIAVNLTTLWLFFLFMNGLNQLRNSCFLIAEGIFVFVITLFLALKGLVSEGSKVEKLLSFEKIEDAREALKALVGRDTETLGKREIQKAVLESYAENLSDGVIAPLFWLTLLGLPGIVFYKTVNTLDSIVGYKNERYLHFGWFSARMDDLLNFIPARITALLIALSSTLYLGLKSGLEALKGTLKYARLHPSPNSGFPEAALAGALGVRLLGPAYYGGKLVQKPYLGEETLSNLDQAIPVARRLLLISSALMLSFILLLKGVK